MFLLLFLGSFLILVMSPPWLDTFPPYFSGSSSTALPRVLAPAWRIRSEGTDLPQDNTTTYYSFSHNHGSGKWLNLKGNDCWRDPFIVLPWLLGGRVPTHPGRGDSKLGSHHFQLPAVKHLLCIPVKLSNARTDWTQEHLMDQNLST